MNTRKQEPDTDIFLDEYEYLTGPVQGLYKTAKNARKYIISGLNAVDEQLKPITYASMNGTLNKDNAIKSIDSWIKHLSNMKKEIIRFQNLSDFEQDALKIRIDFINKKYNQLKRATKIKDNNSSSSSSYGDSYPFYHFPYSNDDILLLKNDDKKDKKDNIQRAYGVNKTDRHYKSIWMDRLLIDYLLRNSHFASAYALVEHNELTILSNILIYHKIRCAILGLKNRNPHIIIKWCRSNKTLLKQYSTNLEFQVKSRVVIQLLRAGNVSKSINYITNEMSSSSSSNWKIISLLFTASMFVDEIFTNNPKYHKLIRNKNSPNYKKYKKEYKNDLRKKIPKEIYKLFFKCTYFWNKINIEFYRIFRLLYNLNKYSQLEYILSSSLQTLRTPYCYHREWTNNSCCTCKYGRNKMSKLTQKSHIRGIELSESHIVCEKPKYINPNNIKNNEYNIINNIMINNDQSLTITKNEDATITPNGRVTHKSVAKVMCGLNKFDKNDCRKVFLEYSLF